MSENAATSGPEQDDIQHGTQGHRPTLDEGDDTQGHLMIRTDETLTPDKKVQDAERRS